MLNALAAGQRAPRALAQLARGTMRGKIRRLEEALECSFFTAGHLAGTSARAARRGAAFCLVRHTLRLSRARAATGRAAALHPHGHQIRTGVRWFSLRRLLYFAAVRAPGTVGSGFRIMLLNWGGAMGIRTPDLLHAIHTPPVAGCGRTWPCVAFTCGFRGWTWPDVA